MKNSTFRRKKSLIDREVQFGFAGIVLGYLLLYTLFLVLLLGLPIVFIMHNTPVSGYDRNAAIGKFLVEDQRFWILIAIFIIAVCIHSIFLTRKFGGPIFAFRRHLKRAQNGELGRINLRKGDSFHDLKDLLNDHFDRVVEIMASCRNSADGIESAITAIESGSDPESPNRNSQTEKFTKIREELSKLREICTKTWNFSG
jgi:methyl-accepting chemotaxis protein